MSERQAIMSNKHVLKKADIEAMKGVDKQHFLNAKARRINKSLGD